MNGHKYREPLVVGDHIFQSSAISIDQGACWCAGLYHDAANYLWYVTNRGRVMAVYMEDRKTFSPEPYKQASRHFWRLQQAYRENDR